MRIAWQATVSAARSAAGSESSSGVSPMARNLAAASAPACRRRWRVVLGRARPAASALAASGWRPARRRKASVDLRPAESACSLRHGGRQGAGRFDELDVVQQHQRLQRRVRAAAADRADFARRRRRRRACSAAARSASRRSRASGGGGLRRSTACKRATSCSLRATGRRPVGRARQAGRPCVFDRAAPTRRARGRESVRRRGGGWGRGRAAGSRGRARGVPGWQRESCR